MLNGGEWNWKRLAWNLSWLSREVRAVKWWRDFTDSKQLLDNGDNEICTKKLSLHWFPPILPVARFYDPSSGFYTARSSPRAILLAHRNLVVARALPERGHKVHFICGSPAPHPLNFIASFPPPQTSSSIEAASYLWIFLPFWRVLVCETFPNAQRDRGLNSFK